MLTIIAYVLFALFFLLDMFFDKKEGIAISHIWHEMFLFLLAIGLAAWQIYLAFKKDRQISAISAELLRLNKDYLNWKEESKSSAGQIRSMIDHQLSDWQLSPSEKDVALLLIKGLSMKEIAEIRKTQEKTVRQQAATVYRKAGLSGRQELAAFFLEDIVSTP